jgi:hypothetical protein
MLRDLFFCFLITHHKRINEGSSRRMNLQRPYSAGVGAWWDLPSFGFLNAQAGQCSTSGKQGKCLHTVEGGS